MITAKHAAQLMIRDKRGLIVEVTENDILSAGGNPLTQAVKAGLKILALNMAAELAPHGVAAVAITPGFLRSETMLERFGVDETTWRDGGKSDPNFLESESPLYVGRAVAALAADPEIMKRTGQLFSSWGLSREYGFNDVDGRRPDWGALDIDFSTLPKWLLDLIRTGTKLQVAWAETIAERTRDFLGRLPAERRRARDRAGANSHRGPRSLGRRSLGRFDADRDRFAERHVDLIAFLQRRGKLLRVGILDLDVAEDSVVARERDLVARLVHVLNRDGLGSHAAYRRAGPSARFRARRRDRLIGGVRHRACALGYERCSDRRVVPNDELIAHFDLRQIANLRRDLDGFGVAFLSF